MRLAMRIVAETCFLQKSYLVAPALVSSGAVVSMIGEFVDDSSEIRGQIDGRASTIDDYFLAKGDTMKRKKSTSLCFRRFDSDDR
ncbi:hypothetical protein QR680_006856 [Steinernema hermaphroditum]|uniref:Uncharacterized protein n=1 Tax=Steinernema hermaphroditum TaxID=289476 RepID=A0AA39HYZ0_9BILA|nr:hypothetical protein QR680_006856 [Steinernema hermaphroditum]